MTPLTRDQLDVLAALAMHGGGVKTRAEMRMQSSRVGAMKTPRRDEAIAALVARGFAEPATVEQNMGQRGAVMIVTREGWRITPAGAAALESPWQEEASPAAAVGRALMAKLQKQRGEGVGA